MRIAWYTPFSIQSAIGRYSQLVVRALRRENIAVDIIRSERKTTNIRGLPNICPDESCLWAADIDRNPQKTLRDYDLVVYNVGDHYDFHTYSVEHQKRVPGLTVLHDYILHHALYRYSTLEGGFAGTYRAHLQAECGTPALEQLDAVFAQRGEMEWWNRQIVKYPVFRWAMSNTWGVITHAEFYRKVVADKIGCPTQAMPLAYDTAITDFTPPRAQPDPLTIVTVGAVNPNKRYNAVLQAISSSTKLRNRCRYRIVGPVQPAIQAELESFIRALHPRPDVTFLGRVDRAVLQTELQQADVISCLRYPALEGASASVIEGLLSGRPVIVCDTGCYREIPSDLVYKVDPSLEVQQITQVLESILENYSTATQRAADARDWAAARHDPGVYARQLLKFVHRVLEDRPMLDIADHLSDYLREWEIVPDEVLLGRIEHCMKDLFGKRPVRRVA